MKRRAFTLIELLVVVAIVGLLAYIIVPVFQRAPNNARRSSCQVNLKKINLALFQYAQDSNEIFPLTASQSRAFGWADAIQPYLKSTQLYQCPSDVRQPASSPSNPRLRDYTDYWLNANASGARHDRFDQPSQQITLGEGSDGVAVNDARYRLYSLPLSWLRDVRSPAYRHLETMNFAFADGHVKAYRGDNLTTLGPPNGSFYVPVTPR